MTKSQPHAAEEKAPLLERIRERVDRARKAATRVLHPGSSTRESTIIHPAYVGDLAAALELVTIELAELRRELEQHTHKDSGLPPLKIGGKL